MEAIFKARREERLYAIRRKHRMNRLACQRHLSAQSHLGLDLLFGELSQCIMHQKDCSELVQRIGQAVFRAEPSERLLDFLLEHWQELDFELLQPYLCIDFPATLRPTVSHLLLSILQKGFQATVPSTYLLASLQKNVSSSPDMHPYLTEQVLFYLQTRPPPGPTRQLLSVLLATIDHKHILEKMGSAGLKILVEMEEWNGICGEWVETLAVVSFGCDRLSQEIVEGKGVAWLVGIAERCKADPVLAQGMAIALCNLACTHNRRVRAQYFKSNQLLELLFLSIDCQGSFPHYSRLLPPLFSYTSKSQLLVLIQTFIPPIVEQYELSPFKEHLGQAVKMVAERTRFLEGQLHQQLFAALERAGGMRLLQDMYR